ncbi:MAG: Hpt domain-containing protein [Candidatus Competibacteraceae bacterium]|nr:Hpt domain-containing protein [Candidatus Competibacteraceae bacterium]MCB1822653.1 Hpt domain-containing protein [Candidatus Competibacteraceae bacterium]
MDTAPAMLNLATALAACRGDPVLVRMLVERYRAKLPEERTVLVQAAAATPPDWESVRQRAHRLQSGSGYLGVERIAEAARQLEASILARDSTDALAAASQALERAFDEFLAIPLEEWERRLQVVNRPAVGAVP